MKCSKTFNQFRTNYTLILKSKAPHTVWGFLYVQRSKPPSAVSRHELIVYNTNVIKKNLLLACSVVLLCLFAATPSSVHADVQVVRGSNGVLYLSTQVTDTPSTSHSGQRSLNTSSDSAMVKQSRTQQPLLEDFRFSNPKIPPGFYTDLTTLINQILRIVMLIAALLSFVYLLWGGFDWITSGGDKGKIQAARSKLIAAVLGLIVVSASYAVLTIVLQFLGFDSLEAVFSNIRVPQ